MGRRVLSWEALREYAQWIWPPMCICIAVTLVARVGDEECCDLKNMSVSRFIPA